MTRPPDAAGRVNQLASWLRSLWPFGGHMMIPERRRRTRWLTLKNAVRAGAVFVVAFILLSLWAEFRPAHSGNSLLQGRAPEPQAVSREPFDVVQEGSIRSYPAPGTIGSDATTAVLPAPRALPVLEQQRVEPQESPLGKGKRIVITGGSEGVQLHVDTTPAPVRKPAPATGTER